jgi:radical SAM/Cys-rich protein
MPHTQLLSTESPTLPWQQPVRRTALTTLQLNLGRYCNLACTHCHVEAGPKRKEVMSATVRERVIAWIQRHRPAIVDLTGGAPELIPGFRELVVAAMAAGCQVMDRCNLAVLDEPGQEDLAAFLMQHRVTVVASLPCYLQVNVDKQRGRGTFDRSIAGLQRLNAQGYGKRPELPLYLVFNPTGATLPPSQDNLEAEYRTRLRDDWGIDFTGLWCLANVPIKRFRQHLERSGRLVAYEDLLRHAYNPATLDHLMCRSTLSVDHEGRLFDCDFHLALDLPLTASASAPKLWDLDPASLTGRPVPMGPHCLACTAGCGSSCTGAVVGS